MNLVTTLAKRSSQAINVGRVTTEAVRAEKGCHHAEFQRLDLRVFTHANLARIPRDGRFLTSRLAPSRDVLPTSTPLE